MTEKFYKLRHIPSGLFFKPSAAQWKKSNLSETGKTYDRKPSLAFAGGYFYTGQQVLSNQKNVFGIDMMEDEQVVVKPEEWEIVVFSAVEEGTISCSKFTAK